MCNLCIRLHTYKYTSICTCTHAHTYLTLRTCRCCTGPPRRQQRQETEVRGGGRGRSGAAAGARWSMVHCSRLRCLWRRGWRGRGGPRSRPARCRKGAARGLLCVVSRGLQCMTAATADCRAILRLYTLLRVTAAASFRHGESAFPIRPFSRHRTPSGDPARVANTSAGGSSTDANAADANGATPQVRQ